MTSVRSEWPAANRLLLSPFRDEPTPLSSAETSSPVPAPPPTKARPRIFPCTRLLFDRNEYSPENKGQGARGKGRGKCARSVLSLLAPRPPPLRSCPSPLAPRPCV